LQLPWHTSYCTTSRIHVFVSGTWMGRRVSIPAISPDHHEPSHTASWWKKRAAQGEFHEWTWARPVRDQNERNLTHGRKLRKQGDPARENTSRA